MKTVFISSFHALISRNILETEILPRIAAKAKVVLLVPEGKVAYFKEEFGSERVSIEGVSAPKKPGEDEFLLWSMSLVGTENHIVRGWKTEGKRLRYYAAHFIHGAFGSFFPLHRLLRFFATTLFRSNAFDAAFAAHRPDLVFATDSFNREDRLLLIEAKRRGIPTVGMIRSWDNATTKGVFLSVPDRVLVTNEVLGEEMRAIHRVDAGRIEVTGIPHYDPRPAPTPEGKERFCREVGLDPLKKTILLAPGGKILYQHDRELLALLKRLVDTGRFEAPVQFLVRFPPGDTVDTSSIEGDPNFAVDDPGTNVTGRKKESEMSRKDNDRLADSLTYSDVVLTLASTMAIDGMVFGKPVVIFGFDPLPNLPDPMSKFSAYVHLRKFLGSGLITISRSEEELVEHLNTYLKNPAHDKEKREKLLARYAYALDGKSSERVATAVLGALS